MKIPGSESAAGEYAAEKRRARDAQAICFMRQSYVLFHQPNRHRRKVKTLYDPAKPKTFPHPADNAFALMSGYNLK